MQFARKEGIGSIPSATGGIARLACARLGEIGKDPAPVLAKAGMTAEEARNPAIWLEVRTQIRLLELAAGELQDDLLGFRLARSFDLREIGLLYYVIASSERLEDALRNAERYSRIMNEGVRLRFSLQDRAATIALDYVNVDRRCRSAPDRVLAGDAGSHLPAGDGHPVGAFATEDETFPKRDAGGIPDVLRQRCRIWRGWRRDLLSGAACSASPCRTRRLPQRAVAAIRGGSARAQPPGTATLRYKVEEILPGLLPHGRAAASEVARRLGMSSRTLSRKLGEEGTSFAEILDQLRAALAKRYLDDEKLPVSEIAWLLGYREVSSLTHAFKRWTGTTPRQFRSFEAAPG